ncbi:MAG: hypothetical protein ACRYG2_34540 [Janthinobacterium lividum]
MNGPASGGVGQRRWPPRPGRLFLEDVIEVLVAEVEDGTSRQP